MSIRSCSLILMTVLTAAFLFAPQAQGGWFCSQVVDRYGQIRRDFKHNEGYTKVIPVMGEIKSQCDLGTCTLLTVASKLEQEYKKRYGKDLKISTEYLAARHWIDESIKTLMTQSSDSVNTVFGSTAINAHALIRSYGILPASEWTLGTHFQSGATASKISEYVRNITARTKLKMKEASNPDEKAKILDEGIGHIKEVFRHFIGELPNRFQFGSEVHNTQTFMDQYFPELKKSMVRVAAKVRPEEETSTITDNGHTFTNASVAEIENLVTAVIDKGHSVFLAFDYNPNFTDQKTGIMSISGFYAPPGSEPLTQAQMVELKIKPNLHATQIVGYDRDPKTGQLIKFLIKNSWGEFAGSKGYYHMYLDYFRSQVRNISFYDDMGVQLPEAN